ncbi:MAG TPA: CheR family methyltransferase [Bacteroidales bacterium]
MIELGIVDTRNIINLIAEKYNYDFSDFALTSFKRRIEMLMEQNNIKHPDILMNRLMENKNFVDSFIGQINVPSTEMFRDPSLWRVLRDEIITNIYRETGTGFKIWLPNSVSGDELFSLAILLVEMGLLDKVQILVSSMSERSLDTIRSGLFPEYKLEISYDNYIRSNGKFSLSNYFSVVNNQAIRDVSLIKHVTFFNQNTLLEPAPQGVKLVLFRNKMIYFNQTLQSKILKIIYNSMTTGGYLVIGAKESLGLLYGNNEFTLMNEAENIYKRRL